MSMLLIDSEVLNRAIKAMDLGFESLSYSGSAFANDVDLAMHALKKAIEESKKHRFSVLEWHPMSEKPKDLSDILIRDTNGAIFDSFAYYYENDWLIHRGDKAQIVEWAYLPE